MTLPTPEFSRAFRLDALSDDKKVEIVATPEECSALAKRFGLAVLGQLSASATLHHGAHGVDAKGWAKARGDQICVVTGEPIPFKINESFSIRFIAAGDPSGEEELELSEADLDVVEHDGNVIDLGEAVAQTLGLSLDPFPRGPNAEARLKEAGVIDEGAAGPFGALAALKEKLAKS
jgi:uncharacterized metal-binding protein YceD (DUF177 family)